MRCAALRNARSLRLNGTNWTKTHTKARLYTGRRMDCTWCIKQFWSESFRVRPSLLQIGHTCVVEKNDWNLCDVSSSDVNILWYSTCIFSDNCTGLHVLIFILANHCSCKNQKVYVYIIVNHDKFSTYFKVPTFETVYKFYKFILYFRNYLFFVHLLYGEERDVVAIGNRWL